MLALVSGGCHLQSGGAGAARWPTGQGCGAGGGRRRWQAHLGQAGGKDVSKVGDALQIVPGLVAEHLT